MPKTTPEIRGKIIGMHESGMLKHKIAERLNLNKNTVSLWIKRYEEEAHLKPREKSTNNRCTTNDTDKKILECETKPNYNNKY